MLYEQCSMQLGDGSSIMGFLIEHSCSMLLLRLCSLSSVQLVACSQGML